METQILRYGLKLTKKTSKSFENNMKFELLKINKK